MESTKKCPDCGRVWAFTKHKSITRDIDTFECDCGKTLLSWSGGAYYTGKLVSGPTRSDEQG